MIGGEKQRAAVMVAAMTGEKCNDERQLYFRSGGQICNNGDRICSGGGQISRGGGRRSRAAESTAKADRSAVTTAGSAVVPDSVAAAAGDRQSSGGRRPAVRRRSDFLLAAVCFANYALGHFCQVTNNNSYLGNF
ncbi:unnamed protein product [Cuscuta epithymum]|uniref:Uncharacterized protein n=1 Tax=Cuscuta epithymum TaxID=186058 RepID=A0AAV0C7Z3_9ASTE|nr:unnamed protein product [Cuscuta epithymum]